MMSFSLPTECRLTDDNNLKKKRRQKQRKEQQKQQRWFYEPWETTPWAAPSSGGCAMKESLNPPRPACSSCSSFSVSHSMSLSLLIPGRKKQRTCLTRNHGMKKAASLPHLRFLRNFTLNAKVIEDSKQTKQKK